MAVEDVTVCHSESLFTQWIGSGMAEFPDHLVVLDGVKGRNEDDKEVSDRGDPLSQGVKEVCTNIHSRHPTPHSRFDLIGNNWKGGVKHR